MPSKLPIVKFVLNPDLKSKLKDIAKREDCSVSFIVRDQLKKFVRRYEVTNGKIGGDCNEVKF